MPMLQLNGPATFIVAVGFVLGVILFVCWYTDTGPRSKGISIPFLFLGVLIIIAALWLSLSPQVLPKLPTFNPLPGQTTLSSSERITGKPTITAQQIDSILAQAGSPAKGLGSLFYDIGVNAGINPAYALAFFHHESSYGLRGVAALTHSIGNIICTRGWPRCIGRFRSYTTWSDSLMDWYRLIKNEYLPQGWNTLTTIIAHYAPATDGNSEQAYVQAVSSDVQRWSRGLV
ncbi:hypothetical protein KSD_48040 [Ktedonobacter sp. SOSP1-85]|uniref:glucosaminidase domain-containing protein n=1 Tax=Ktedonobacter sp. SOSP1-85 TaxID=2778367 RepID=UPI0019160A56|nr:glucosaminidase domain-containing protein [Ktedonobacter sp. SOSP1-85]GHO77033.1 hypothetical protein KSD_48040 [Ktedonobacter sp. SOSP1-85]